MVLCRGGCMRSIAFVVLALLGACAPAPSVAPDVAVAVPAQSAADAQKKLEAIRQSNIDLLSSSIAARTALLRMKLAILEKGDRLDELAGGYVAGNEAKTRYVKLIDLLSDKPDARQATKAEMVAYLDLMDAIEPKDGDQMFDWESRMERLQSDLTKAANLRQVELDIAYPALRPPARTLTKEQFLEEAMDAANQAEQAAKESSKPAH